MAFPLDDIFPGVGDPKAPHPATFGPLGDLGGGVRCAGLIVHTTEGSGYSRDAAVATATWQRSNPGSYNFICYSNDSPGAQGGLLLTVPYLEASGGINPASTAWAPKAWLTSALGAKVMADPARYQLQVAFSGKAADFAAGSNPANMIDTVAQLVLWIEQQPWGADNLVLSAHADYQTNRTDPGAGVVDRILRRYDELRGATTSPSTADVMAKLESTKQQVVAQSQIIADLKTLVGEKNAALDRVAPKVGALAEQVDAIAKSVASLANSVAWTRNLE